MVFLLVYTNLKILLPPLLPCWPLNVDVPHSVFGTIQCFLTDLSNGLLSIPGSQNYGLWDTCGPPHIFYWAF